MVLDRVLGFGAVLLATLVGLASWRFGLGTPMSPGPGFWPFLVTLCILGLGATLVLRPDHGFRAPRDAGSRWSSLWTALATMAVFVLALEPLGYPLTTGLLLVAQFRWVEGRAWRMSLVTAVLAAAVSFVVFRLFLKVPLPAGVLPLPRGW
jgi:putative tricarboxylic transport membrane protein